ncbi:FKBP-type peptidyl-prolyl cis-trans isomerase [Planctomicrobium sp. SH668]|uniref:FKBP-type peptidyl-prolyl cis-trans isomerase n=1 Tax=Planctomicrobium sp. SH668 TaxID=3448126 RepID=UPI003F5B0A20
MNKFFAFVILTSFIAGCGVIDEEQYKKEKGAEELIPVAKPEAASAPQEETPSPNAGDESFVTTESGLKYKILKEGEGKQPTANDTVEVFYRGWLDNGNEFDGNFGQETISFPLKGVIPGWTEGLQHVKEGGKIQLEIPSKLGYGERGQPPVIPGNSRLHFEVELVKIK